MVVPMKGLAHSQALAQCVEDCKPVGMTARRLMRHQHIRSLSAQRLVLRREDRAAMPSRQTIAPPVAAADVGHIRARRLDFRWPWRHPYLPPKYPTQSRDAHPGDLDYPAMQVAASQCRAEQMIVVLVRIGVMVAWNEHTSVCSRTAASSTSSGRCACRSPSNTSAAGRCDGADCSTASVR